MTFRPAVVLLALQLGVVPAFAQRDGGFQRWPTRDRAAGQAPARQGEGARSRDREAAPAPARQGEQGARTRERESQPRTVEAARAPVAREAAPERTREATVATERRQDREAVQPQAVQRREAVQRGEVAEQRDRQARERNGAQDRGSVRGRDGAQDRGGVRGRDDVRARDIGRDRDGGRVAVPRQGPAPRIVQRSSRTNIYIGRPPSYRYTPRFSRPYVYGSLGPGYFYYGSYGWYPRATYYYDGGYFGRGYGYDTGEVRLQVEPRFAEVYVDGYYAGTVDDFDGTFQSLRLESGPYHIEIVAPGYDVLEVDLRVSAGQKITYRGNMRPEF